MLPMAIVYTARCAQLFGQSRACFVSVVITRRTLRCNAYLARRQRIRSHRLIIEGFGLGP